jgi:hypothetical protein
VNPDNAEVEDEDNSKAKLYSVEIDPLIASVAMNLVSLAGLQDFVEVIVGGSAHTLRRFQEQETLGNGGIDMLFLDHDEALYEADVKLAEELGFLDKHGALIIADNVVRPGAPEYRDYMRKNRRLGVSWGLPALIVPGEFEVCFSPQLFFSMGATRHSDSLTDCLIVGRDGDQRRGPRCVKPGTEELNRKCERGWLSEGVFRCE